MSIRDTSPAPNPTSVQLAALSRRIARFTRVTRERGERYFRQRRVGDASWDGETALTTVRGSFVYEVAWCWFNDQWQSDCACPVGTDCKHAYAFALALLSLAAPVAAPKPTAATPQPRPRAAPRGRNDLATAFAATRDTWVRRGIVSRLLAHSRFLGLSGYDPAVEQILDEPDPETLCWRLAQLIAARTGALPAELEPFRDRVDLASRYAAREQQRLVDDLVSWARAEEKASQRSLRFVWSLVPGPAGNAVLHVAARLTTNRLHDEPRSIEQLHQLRAESQRNPATLAPDQAELLAVFMDASTRLSSWLGSAEPGVALAMLRAGGDPGPLMCWAPDLPPDLCARAGIEPGAPLRLAPASVRILPSVDEAPGGARIGLACLWPDDAQRWLSEVVYLPSARYNRSPSAVLADGCLAPVYEEPPADVRLRLLAAGGIEVPRAQCADLLAPLANRFTHMRSALAARTRHLTGTAIVSLDLRDDDWLQIRIFLHTGGEEWMPGPDPCAGTTVLERTPREQWQPWLPALAAGDTDYERITPSEASADAPPADAALPADEVWFEEPAPEIVGPAVDWLAATGAAPGAAGRPGGHQPTAVDRDVGWWMHASARRMAGLAEAWDARPAGVRFIGTERIRRLLAGGQVLRPRIRVTASGVDWFAVSAEWQREGVALSEADMAKLRTATSRFVRLPSGWARRDDIDAHDASAAALADLGVEAGGGKQRITLWQLAGARPESLSALDQLAEGRAAVQALATLRRQLARFTGVPAVPVPGRISATLRPYQQRGLDFLAYGARLGIGSVLADDMGLGKTVQALAWLQHLVDEQPGGGPSLVVCPTSVMHNWAREAAQFAPALRVLLLARGAQRHALRKNLAHHDLVITNYALLRQDIEQWTTIELRAAILDEAQNIKNPDAAVSHAACALRARHRLALTGTPLENRPLDLWSIARFVNPGYLGSRDDFSARFDRLDAPPHARALLAAKLRPMLLRRLKQEVAPDLPERIEERRDCELTSGQRQLYLAELRRSRRLVDELSADPTALRKNKITILAALTRLRQICCHPALAKGKASIGSGKFEALFELLEPLLAEGHKVLLFSQFVQCLKLLDREMTRRDIAHHLLTGQTVRREAVVQAFQDDERPSVFLISLKAGGTGLNLTAATYVVLFDPWWNPAVEAQAIDRSHRIGQDRTVIAYRLIARGTIEEKIWELQQQKTAMVRDILGEAGFARALNRADLDFLLREGEAAAD